MSVSQAPYLRASQFSRDAALLATSLQPILLDAETQTSGGAEQILRYQLDAGIQRFCLAAGQDAVSSFALFDAQENSLLVLAATGSCGQVDLSAGLYTARLEMTGHQSNAVLFAQSVAPTPRLVNTNGLARAGWWAVQLDPTSSINPQRSASQLVAAPEEGATVSPAAAHLNSTAFGDNSLFRLSDPTHPLVNRTGTEGLGLNVMPAAQQLLQPGYIGFGIDSSTSQPNFFATRPLTVIDRGNYRFQLGTPDDAGQVQAAFFADLTRFGSPLALVLNTPGSTAVNLGNALFDLAFRYFPDGAIDTLQEGEVAIYQGCNFSGKAVVYGNDVPDISRFDSDVTTLAQSGSIRLGPNTVVYLNSGLAYSGTRQQVKADTVCLTQTPIGSNATVSIFIRPLLPTIFIGTPACVGCNLAGIDLSGLDLSKVDLSDAILTGATLTGATLPKIGMGNLEGATLDRVTGLAGSDQRLATLRRASVQNVDLSGIKLYGANLDNANLSGSDLSKAFLSSLPPTILAAASLQGAQLMNVNLSSADLNGADFTRANLYSSGAVVPLPCNFSALNCSTAAGASMKGTSFVQAFMYGVDLSKIEAEGANFFQAVLTGANFDGATLVTAGDSGSRTTLSQAFLQGAEFDSAQIDGLSLDGAFVDFTSNALYATLDTVGSTDFAACPTILVDGKAVCQTSVCLYLAYAAGTLIDSKAALASCPSGDAGPCGVQASSNAKWNVNASPAQMPGAWYANDSTYIKATSPPAGACLNADTDFTKAVWPWPAPP